MLFPAGGMISSVILERAMMDTGGSQDASLKIEVLLCIWYYTAVRTRTNKYAKALV